MKRFLVLTGIIFYSVALMAQTPQEIKTLRNRVGAFAYATKVEQTNATKCKVWLSSGDSLVLCCGKEKAKTIKTLNVGNDEIVLKPHKGKVIKISRKPDQVGALLALYKATEGKAWTCNKGWGDTKQSLSNWEGVVCNEDGDVTHLKLANNNLQGELPDVFYAFPKLRQLLLNKNQLTGEVPRSVAWVPDECTVRLQHNKLSETTLYVPRERLMTLSAYVKSCPQQEGYKDFRLFFDCDVDLNPVNGYYENNECRLYHKATEGAGIDIYILGEGYDKAEYAKGGTAEYWLERAADAMFELKPYSQLKHLFNVYIIYSYSEVRGISILDNPRNSRFGFWAARSMGVKATRKKQELYNTCKEAVTNAGFKFAEGKLHIQLVANNSTINGGSHQILLAAYDEGEKRYMSVAFNPTYTTRFNQVIQHEFCGHAFGDLRDEYRKKNLTKTFPKSSIPNANVDLESDPTKVKWAQFITDPRYASEKLGVYQGILSFKDVYRATETSIMRSIRPGKGFNAPSRAAIYTKAMKLAFPGWEFDYEEFVKFDMGDKYYPLEK